MIYPSQEFDDAVAAMCHGTLNDNHLSELALLLRTDETARDAYLFSIELHARLSSENTIFVPSTLPNRARRVWNSRRTFFAAAALIVIGLLIWKPWIGEANGVSVLIVDARNVAPPLWKNGTTAMLKDVRIDSGTLRLKIEKSGVELTVPGPASLMFVDAMRVRALHGQIIADVGERGKGFAVETAQGQFVDLGTVFGINAGSDSTTDLLVFKGSVQVYADSGRAAPLSTLEQGEAVRMGGNQTLSRLPSVVTGSSIGGWSTIPPRPDECAISSVRDNLRNPGDKVFYQIIPGGMKECVQAYVGPEHLWKGRTEKGLPPYLVGADFVRTFISDRQKKNLAITVTLSKPAVLYVLFECREQQKKWRDAENVEQAPQWLQRNFKKTGDAVGLDDAGQLRTGESMSNEPGKGHLVTFDVWKRVVNEAGEVELGPPTGSDGWLNWMYGIAVQPLNERNAH